MKRLPTTEELDVLTDEVNRQLLDVSVADFDRFLAALDVAVRDCEVSALDALQAGRDAMLYAGGVKYLKDFRDGILVARKKRAEAVRPE